MPIISLSPVADDGLAGGDEDGLDYHDDDGQAVEFVQLSRYPLHWIQ